ncbi:hypothetical protein FOA52_013327 [Chlamydomonas sp. UWO 241]|nr:hypothetical protein FOA52_013327 [Chlamydomonas sp. UWO 241]
MATTDYSSVRKVLVVGAGVAGLQAARHLLSAGFKVVVLEATEDVGGVWRQNYVGYKLQMEYDLYVFPDFPYPSHLQPKDEVPTGAEVQAYIKAYAEKFGLLSRIRFHTKMLQLRQAPDGHGWTVLCQDTRRQETLQVSADFVVVSNGLYSHPNVPHYHGQETFKGVKIHANAFTDTSIVRGRDVVIVGNGKTAHDCVATVVASKEASSVVALYRNLHWPIPRHVCGIQIRHILFTRATSAMLPPYYTARGPRAIMSKACAPVKRLWWGFLEGYIKHKFPLSGGAMKPTISLPGDFFMSGKILEDDHHMLTASKQLRICMGDIQAFTQHGVLLRSGECLKADAVLFCTGFAKVYDYLSGDVKAKLGLYKDGLYLYRHLLSPGVPNLCFLGSEVSTFNSVLTHGLQALWLTNLLTGALKLPTRAEMQADVMAQRDWRCKVMPGQRQRGSSVMLYMQDYHDQLVADVGMSPRRKTGALKVFSEAFKIYSAKDYAGLFEPGLKENERAQARRKHTVELKAARAEAAMQTATMHSAEMHSPAIESAAEVAAGMQSADMDAMHSPDRHSAAIQSFATQPSAMLSSAVQSAAMPAAGVQTAGVQTAGMQSSATQSAAIQSAAMQAAGVQTAGIQIVQSAATRSASLHSAEMNVVHSAAIHSAAVQYAAKAAADMQSADMHVVHSAAMHSAAIQSAAMQSAAMQVTESSAMQTAAMHSAAMQTADIQSAAKHAAAIQPLAPQSAAVSVPVSQAV